MLHYLEVLRDRVGFDAIKEKVTYPLTGKKIGAYYGCLLLRPGKVLEFDNPENPKIMEDFIRHWEQSRSFIHIGMSAAAVTFH